jgi:hypothetical protein
MLEDLKHQISKHLKSFLSINNAAEIFRYFNCLDEELKESLMSEWLNNMNFRNSLQLANNSYPNIPWNWTIPMPWKNPDILFLSTLQK